MPDLVNLSVGAGGFVFGFLLSGAHPVHHWRLRRSQHWIGGRSIWCWRCGRYIDIAPRRT